MKRNALFLAALMVALLFAVLTVGAQDNIITLPENDIAFGVYDPTGNLIDNESLTVEQRFLNWLDDAENTRTAIDSILGRGRVPLIALEPYSWGGYNGLGSDTLLTDIATGFYDEVILAQCQVLASYAPQPIIVRYGHEQDLYNLEAEHGQFEWSTPYPNLFIAAYRYFVTACRNVGATNVQFMWSPAGTRNSALYYPGADVVDYVGLTVLGYAEWDMQFSNIGRWRSFNELLWEKYSIIMAFQKPVIIAELGVCCGQAHQAHWLQDAYHAMHRDDWYPLLVAAVYFNDVNPTSPWAVGLTPDWRVCSSLFPETSFSAAVNEGRDLRAETCDEFAPLEDLLPTEETE